MSSRLTMDNTLPPPETAPHVPLVVNCGVKGANMLHSKAGVSIVLSPIGLRHPVIFTEVAPRSLSHEPGLCCVRCCTNTKQKEGTSLKEHEDWKHGGPALAVWESTMEPCSSEYFRGEPQDQTAWMAR